MPKFTFKDGVLSSDSYVKATRQYTCGKGTVSELTLDMPEGLTVQGAINVNAQCPCCGEKVVIPTGKHSVNSDGVLVTE
ncbi:hypothetical protein [Pseudomonas lundensis]|uniref:PAAR domain-containing protein n=1 Tax=Pseudomonas lundensis TaxID=86185 RepID=A0AAX2HCE3_9PSED|nr:hypothetical protein [Pseudomonas lundensis]SOB53865.1 hypothetical protein PLUA15_460055 [Pseudomonas lundensis]